MLILDYTFITRRAGARQSSVRLTAMSNQVPLGEVLFEFIRHGNVVRVSALHVDSNIEVTIMGPATAPQRSLQNVALQKLRYVLAKKI
jgi:hypothetical protein